MLTTAIIAFREFLEAFLLVGMFIGINKKFGLGKQKEILSAAILGIGVSIFLPIAVFFLGNDVARVLTEKNADILEGYLLTFSGFFLVYVVFSLHEFMKEGKKKTIAKTYKKMEQEIFDISLFLTLVFFIIREGFEVALLTATTSVFSVFTSNVEGLIIGFAGALVIGVIASFTYIRVPLKHIFTYTEYLIILIGSAMVKNGISLLLTNYLHIELDKILTIPFTFLPGEDTVFGHALSNLTGIEQHVGVIQFAIMGTYIIAVWFLFRVRKPHASIPSNS